MRKKITPRFPESLAKLRRAIKLYNNNARLSRLTGISVQTLAKIADGTTSFPWAQTVEAVWKVLEEPKIAPLKTEKVVIKTPVRLKSRDARRRRSGHTRSAVRTKRPQVRVGRPF